MTIRFQLRRGTSADWSSANPVLSDGEIGFDLTLGIYKIGNGSSAWNSLPFSSGLSGITGANGSTGATGIKGGITAPENWNEVTSFNNGWVNYNNGFETAAYYKDQMGIVHLKGTIYGFGGYSAFTLGSGYYPTKYKEFIVSGNGGTDRIEIASSGYVTPIHNTGGYFIISLDGISFRV